ncbi:RidA family protein [Tunturiibacter gelidiferens]|uniref:RidA family protein n=1 Tax=Tunturiibacter gelidiferens TaxID=3069689 RepID=UPI003D9B490B
MRGVDRNLLVRQTLAKVQPSFERTLQTKMTRKNISGTSPFEPIIGFSRAVRIGNHVHVSGTGPVGADSADVTEQTDQCLTLIEAALKNAGSSIEHVYRTRMYLTRAEDWEAVGRVHGKFFGLVRPAATMVIVAALLNPAWRIEIEADSFIPE